MKSCLEIIGACKNTPRGRLIAGVAGVLALMPMHAVAAEWSTDVGTSITATHETNPRLSTNDKRSNEELIFSPFIESRFEGERGNATFNASADVVRSTDKNIRANTESYDFGAEGEREFERSVMSAGAAWSRVEFQNSDFDENELLFTTDPNINTTEDTVDELSLNARYEHEVDDRTSVFVSDDFRDVRFSADGSTDFRDNDIRVGAIYEHIEGLIYTPSVAYEIFDPEGRDRADVYRAEVAVEYTPSETERILFAPGVVQSDNNLELTLEAEYTQQFELFSVTGSASRDLEPDDDGGLRQTTKAGVTVSHDVSEVTSLSGNVDWVETDTNEVFRVGSTLTHEYTEFVTTGFSLNWRHSEPDNPSVLNNRDVTQITANPFVSWIINEELNARLAYTAIREKESGDDAAYSHLFSVALNYSLTLD